MKLEFLKNAFDESDNQRQQSGEDDPASALSMIMTAHSVAVRTSGTQLLAVMEC